MYAHSGGDADVELLFKPTIQGVDSVQMFGERAHLRLQDSDESDERHLADRLRAAGVEPTSVRAVKPSLEDVFVARLGELTS